MQGLAVPYVRVNHQYDVDAEALNSVVTDVLHRRAYVGDALVEELEAKLATYCETRYAVTLNSGTDALMLGMVAAGITRGDEVITPPNSFVASTAAIAHIGAKPVFADVLPDQNIDPSAIEAAITPRTKAIMPVHLSGRMARMDRIVEIAERHKLLIIEDAAQAIGSRYGGRAAGSIGTIGCFSTHPLKNLNACGDGGFITTNDPAIANRVKRLRSHGMSDRNTVVEWGFVSRMDTMQAAILLHRLESLPDVLLRRRVNAQRYQAMLAQTPIDVPQCRPEEWNTFHTFVIQIDERDRVQASLAAQGIGTAIHYPVPLHLQPAAAKLGYVRGDFPATEHQATRILSLPIHQFLAPQDQEAVVAALRNAAKH